MKYKPKTNSGGLTNLISAYIWVVRTSRCYRLKQYIAAVPGFGLILHPICFPEAFQKERKGCFWLQSGLCLWLHLAARGLGYWSHHFSQMFIAIIIQSYSHLLNQSLVILPSKTDIRNKLDNTVFLLVLLKKAEGSETL